MERRPTWDDPAGALVPHGKVEQHPTAPGPLSGVTVAVKDLFDWKGVPTGAGNPTWLETHPIPDKNAPILDRLLAQGATLRGKTITDELAYSIQGDNVHYGTPVNTAAPDRVPGGSSSGSAAAVAAGMTDAALGTDTGGSVRVPATYCGLYGIRTTHGAIPTTGVVALAPRFDTVGWFAKTGTLLETLTTALVAPESRPRVWGRVFVLEETRDLTDPETARLVEVTAQKLGTPVFPLPSLLPSGGLETLRKAYGTVQGWEAWNLHGPWILACRPRFGPAIAGRFTAASQVTEAEAQNGWNLAMAFRSALRTALGEGGLLVLPATAGPAPTRDTDPSQADQARIQTMRLTCLAGLAGLPQVTVPYRGADGLPRGVGIVGPAGSDRSLAALAAKVGP